MTAICYEQLALDWSPVSKSNWQFNLIALVVVIAMFSIGVILSSISIPKEERIARQDVPERIANFIVEKKKKEPKIVKPEPEVVPKPPLKPKRIIRKKADKKPLSKAQKKFREKAAKSGLLALSSELVDLMDTSEVSALVGAKTKSGTFSSEKSMGYARSLLMANASAGSGGVNERQYQTVVGKTKLSQREITQVKQSLLSSGAMAKTDAKAAESRTGSFRAEEDITLVFDQNKSQLYSIYNRARRKNASLKGKLVLEITIAPSGKVTQINVVSSELSDAKLVSRLVSRIKQFNFGAQNVNTVVVTYPVEFLPS